MSNGYVLSRKFSRGNVGVQRITIQGRTLNRNAAKMLYLCIHCLGKLKQKNHGLTCELNDCHYGFIHRNKARKLTQEERFMRIGEMFPSEYLRGIDVAEPMKVRIKDIKEETTRERETGKPELEYVVYFDGIPKKLRLNVTMAKDIAKILNDPTMDTDNWTGKHVTIYRTTLKAFGKDHIVPRVRGVKKGDKLAVDTSTGEVLESTPTQNGSGKPSVDPVTQFWTQAKALGIDSDHATSLLKEAGGGKEGALKAIEKLVAPVAE